jgi:CRISPR type I-E-associated protein CasB/Cse2
MSEKRDWIEPFIKKLRTLDPPDQPQDTKRAELARLRQGLGQPSVKTLTRLGWLFAGVPNWEGAVDDAVLVAGLFAAHSGAGGSGSLGKAMRRYRDLTGAEESTDKRFAYLVDSEAEELPERLRHIVKLLKYKDIPVDFRQLLEDIRGWNWESRSVQWQWSREYWKAITEEPDDTESETSTPSTEGVAQ